jgi:hypothetical protein
MARDLGHDAPPTWPRQQAFDPVAQPSIRQSAAAVARDQGSFIRQLHNDIADLIPESALPPGFDMQGFCARMAQALLWLALSDQPPDVAADALCQLGRQNWYEGFPDSQYASVAHALIQTMHYLTANEWSASTGSAWISFFMWMQPHLLAGAQQAAAAEAAARQAAAREAAAQRAEAEQEAARIAALARDPRGGQAHVVYNANLERVAALLEDDEDDQDVGLGQIMLGMTRPSRHKD